MILHIQYIITYTYIVVYTYDDPVLNILCTGSSITGDAIKSKRRLFSANKSKTHAGNGSSQVGVASLGNGSEQSGPLEEGVKEGPGSIPGSSESIPTEPGMELSQERRESGQERRESGQERSELGQERRESGQERRESGQERSELGQERSELGQERRELGQERRELGQERRVSLEPENLIRREMARSISDEELSKARIVSPSRVKQSMSHPQHLAVIEEPENESGGGEVGMRSGGHHTEQERIFRSPSPALQILPRQCTPSPGSSPRSYRKTRIATRRRRQSQGMYIHVCH